MERELSPIDRLTPRELEVLRWVSEGKTNWEIGRILSCSTETVKKHLHRAYRKLGVEKRIAAVRYLQEHGDGKLQAA